MRTSMDDADALAGLRLLVAGGDLATVRPARDRLAALGADVDRARGRRRGRRARGRGRPARGGARRGRHRGGAAGAARSVRARRRAAGDRRSTPPPPGTASPALRLRALVERRELRARQAELEAAGRRPGAGRARASPRRPSTTSLQRLCRRPATATTTRSSTRSGSEHLAARLARGLGLSDREVALILRAAPLHDIGKIAIPDSILLKPGRLTEEEFEVVKTHAVLGARVLAGGGSDAAADRGGDRAPPPRALGRRRLPRGPGRRRDPRRGAARARRRRLRRARPRAPVPGVARPSRPRREEIARGAGTDFDPEIVAVFARIGPAG